MDLTILEPTSRPWRSEPALGCASCFMKNECGGWHDEGIDCFQAGCCGKTDTCTYACVRADNFAKVYRDTGGFSSVQQWKLYQRQHDWPGYIPVIQNKSSRRAMLHRQVIAIPTSKLLRWGSSGEKAYRSREDFCKSFRLSRQTEIIALSVEKDPPLESYWKYRHIRSSAMRLKSLGINRVICPDFSTAVNLPRLDNLANRRRSLICAEEFSAVGISVVPFFLANHVADWQFWLWFLKEHPQITVIAKEFQTGASRRKVGEWHARALLELEQKLGRGLHLVAVGGRRFIPMLAHLHGLTVMDSNPFMKSVKRRRLTIKNQQWAASRTAKGAPIDELLNHNTCIYEQYILGKIKNARSGKSERRVSSRGLERDPKVLPPEIDSRQSSLPFSMPNGRNVGPSE